MAVTMIFKYLIALVLSFSLINSTDQIDKSIQQKKNEIAVLSAEVKEAQKTVGLAETMDYVEKIGLIEQLNNELVGLEKQKAAIEAQQH